MRRHFKTDGEWNDFKEAIGPMLKDAREAKGISKYTVAAQLEIGSHTLTKLESGDRTVYLGLYMAAWSEHKHEISEQAILDRVAEIRSCRTSCETFARPW